MKLKKFSLYNLFHNRRDDLDDLQAEDTTPTLKRFFKLLGRRFWKLISIDLMMLPMFLPIMLAGYLYITIPKTPSVTNPLFSQLFGANLFSQTTESTFLLDLFGSQYQIPAYNNLATYIGIGICLVFLLVTFGWQNVGCTYLLRAIVRGEPIFLFSDYFYAIKKNFKQGFFLGLLDFAVLFLLAFDFLYFSGMAGSSFGIDVMFWAITALAILYFFMRFYLYLLQITFNLSIRKILKNALIFITLGVKRNVMALIGMIILVSIVIGAAALLIAFFGFGAIGILLIMVPMFFLSFTAFMSAYAAYPVIDRYMIAPFVSNDEDEELEEYGEDDTDNENEETEASSSDTE